LQDPEENFLIIDGQHRLAALQFYERTHPDDAKNINVPCVVFDGRSEDFATEMFVIINSTPTRINKSHLLTSTNESPGPNQTAASPRTLSRCSTAKGTAPCATASTGSVVEASRRNGFSRPNLQRDSSLGEASLDENRKEGTDKRAAARYYAVVRDFLKAAAEVWGQAWGNSDYMVTKPVTLKAMVRVCADLAAEDADPEEARIGRWRERLSPWREQIRNFRNEGFYERFPAKGQVERVARIHRELARLASISPRGRK
jgi:DGQHR domain-containing protein